MSIYETLNDAICTQRELSIETKERGTISGIPHSLDEFDTDEGRLGCNIWVNEHKVETVYFDEIVSIVSAQVQATA